MAESLLSRIDQEENEQRRMLIMRLDTERVNGLAEITDRRKNKIKAMTKEEWIREHSFWIGRLAIRKWELETPEEKENRGGATVKALQAGIDKFLDNYTFDVHELTEMNKEELVSLVKEDIAFAELVLEESIVHAGLIE